jgi:dynein heavy chain
MASEGEDNAHLKEKDREGREEALLETIGSCMNVKARDKLKRSMFESEEHKEAIAAFLHSDTPATALFVIPQSADTVVLSTDTPSPDKFKRKGFVILRMDDEPLHREGFGARVTVLEVGKGLLEQMHLLLQGVLGPLMQNPANQQGWSDLVTKDLMERFNQYTAQLYYMMGLAKGKTWLPLPSKKVIESEGPEKDKAHVFEVCLSMWTKQIKNVLRLESEQALKGDSHPGPHVELEFWENRAANLNLIHDQLQSVEIKGILRFLERSKSTYTNPFSKLQKEIEQARVEANDNTAFLSTLKNFLELFRDNQF